MTTLRDIRETLTLSAGASNLVQPVIARALFESKRAFTPLHFIFPRKTVITDKYIFNKRTQFPRAQMTTEAPPLTGTGSVAASSSTYNQIVYSVKNMQVQLDISDISIQVARANGNLVDLELNGAAESMIYLEEMMHLYGNSGATLNTLRRQWDGVDSLTATSNKLDANTALFSLAMFDSMIDKVKTRTASELGQKYAFVVTPELLSAINRQFLTYAQWKSEMTVFARDDYGIPGGPIINNKIAGGFDVAAYRGIPIIESSFLASLGQMGTVTGAASGTGSSLSGATYLYYVEVVTDYGISLASAEVTVTPTAGENVTLSWSTPSITDADGNVRPNLNFRIHRTAAAGASGSESLYAIVSAFDNTDTAITSITDTGHVINPVTTTTAYAITVASTDGVNAVPDGVTFPRVQTGTQVVEDAWLLPRDPDILLVAVLNEMRTKMLATVNARSEQIALIGDETLALRGTTFLSKLSRVRAS